MNNERQGSQPTNPLGVWRTAAGQEEIALSEPTADALSRLGFTFVGEAEQVDGIWRAKAAEAKSAKKEA